VSGGSPEPLTTGSGIEVSPVITGDGKTVAFLRADAQQPMLPAVFSAVGSSLALAADRIPADFPSSSLVTPRPVILRAADGVEFHCQLFETGGGGRKKPAVVFAHGGPRRQMYLGWHERDYYANAYALNQYLAARGYVVLSVNFRLGIGYGFDFEYPEKTRRRGAAEYRDILAAGKYLQSLPQVDPKRIGIWGGSYGGLLTALALARNSDIFAAGVDVHGVHDWTEWGGELKAEAQSDLTRVEKNNLTQALRIAWESSPVADIKSWKSPVLLIHGDDDRNVEFVQTIDLVNRLRDSGVSVEELMLPDEVHGFLLHRSWLQVNKAIADFFDRKLR
jgi:dipeptidyl aminopeptidase/acylaminoacyl peptidase